MAVRTGLQILLVVVLLAMALLAAAYLCRRRLTWQETVVWGMVAFFLPLLGPFLVIAIRPGLPRQTFRSQMGSTLARKYR